jgi:hypothetical protein
MPEMMLFPKRLSLHLQQDTHCHLANLPNAGP